MKKFFKSCTTKNDNGWMQLSAGNSCIDNEDYVLTTEHLKCDEVPVAMCDAKTATELIAGLLNAFYNKIDVSKWQDCKVIQLGIPHEQRNVPSDLNSKLPF